MLPRPRPVRPEDVAAAALLATPFGAYLVVLSLLASPSEGQWAAADPILHILPREPTLWLPPAAAGALAAGWWRLARPDPEALRRGAVGALAGVVTVGAAVLALRVAAGATMPAFLPPEESAGPGFLLSMTAGFGEELVCRLAVLPALYFGLRGRLPGPARAIVAVAATALVFALWHSLGEGRWVSPYFLPRFLLPGCLMGALFFVSPSAVVVGHATAHLLIPGLFLAPPA